MKASESFMKNYAEELVRTSRFDAGAIEMVMRDSLSSMSEDEIRALMPLIIRAADEAGIGLFVAAEIVTSKTAKDLARYDSPSLAEAARKMRENLKAVPASAAVAREAERAMPRTWWRRFVRWVKRI
jgi:hypothetical protein